MGVHYSQEHGRTVAAYVCQETLVRRGGKTCQSVPGKVVDPAVGALLVELMTPMTLEVTLAVQRELEARTAETDALRRQHLERTHYDAELARRRYMKVDPDNRLVADALEAEWNDKLRIHADAVADYDNRRQQQAASLDVETRRRILDLAEHFPQVWHDPRVDIRERKRILRLLVDDVTLVKAETIIALCACRGVPRAPSRSIDPYLSRRSASSTLHSLPRLTASSIITVTARSQKSSISAAYRPGKRSPST
jgi:hypothetical protein